MSCVSKEYEIKTIEQEQCLQLKMLFLLGYNLKIVAQGGGGGGGQEGGTDKNLVGVIFLGGGD